MQALTNRTFDEIDVGASTSVTHTLYKAEGGLLNCSAAGFAKAMDISCHSFINIMA